MSVKIKLDKFSLCGQQTSLNKKYDNSTLKKINRPVAFAARFAFQPARPRMAGVFADRACLTKNGAR